MEVGVVDSLPQKYNMYKLKYFNARGAGEIIRLLFASAKVSFEDIRFPMDMTTYARPEFEAAKVICLVSRVDQLFEYSR